MILTMAAEGKPWQLECEKVEQRCGYLLTSGTWSDCTFMVGTETNQEVIQAHKLILAMASPVFEAMFYGGLSEQDQEVKIPDMQPKAFRGLLQYIYTGDIKIESVDMAWDLFYGANKYMLPHLITECDRYINSSLSPKNACRAFEFAQFYDNKALMDKCMKIISTNTKEVLRDSSFTELELNTVIAVCSLDHLNIDSELEIFHAVKSFADAEKNRLGQANSPVDGVPPSNELPDESSQASLVAEQESKTPTEVDTSEPVADEEEEPSIRAALQQIRFLSLSAEEFTGPASSGLLTLEESYQVFMNIASKNSKVPLPSGFSDCRERRQPFSEPKEQCLEDGCIKHTISALKSKDPDQVKAAVEAAGNILRTPHSIQPALDMGMLDALVPALTDGDSRCKLEAARAIFHLCEWGSASQLDVLAASAALQPYCLLLPDGGDTCYHVLRGLTYMLQKVEQQNTESLHRRLQELHIQHNLVLTHQFTTGRNCQLATNLLQTYFSTTIHRSNVFNLFG